MKLRPITPLMPQKGGVPKGGTTGQLLKKASAEDYDTAWQSGGGGGVDNFLDLTDTPDVYTGFATKVVSVKNDETGLEFTSPASPGAPDTAHYVTTQAEAGLSNEFNLGGLTSGLLKHTVAAGVSTPATAVAGTDYLNANQTITLSSDVTGSGATAIATTIANNAVTYAKMQDVSATSRFLGRITAGAGDPEELTAANAKTILALTKSDVGLANVTNDEQTKAAVVPNSVPSTGDLLIGDGVGGYAVSAMSGDATIAANGTFTIADDAITYAKMQNVSATSRFLGRITAAAGDVEELTAANAKTILALTSGDVGLGNVTNDAQTKNAVVPNTAPSSGQILVGNAGGTAYAKQTLSGSGATASLSDAGVLTLSAIPNATLSNSAITIAGTSTSLGGTITQDTITGLSSTGLVKRTGANALTTITDNSATWATGGWTALKVAGSDFTTTSTSLVDITGLVSSTLSTATLYEFEANLYCNSTSTAGMAVGVQQSGTGTGQIGVWSGAATSATATGIVIASNALNQAGAPCVLVNGDGSIQIRGFIKTGSSGSPTISCKVLKTTSGTAKVYIGSTFRFRAA